MQQGAPNHIHIMHRFQLLLFCLDFHNLFMLFTFFFNTSTLLTSQSCGNAIVDWHLEHGAVTDG